MANKHRGEVAIHLDKKRTLRLDVNSLADLEDTHGITVRKILENLEQLSSSTIRKVIRAGLVHELPNLTLEETGNLINKHYTLVGILEVIMKAIEYLTPDVEEDEKKEPSGLSGVGVN